MRCYVRGFNSQPEAEMANAKHCLQHARHFVVACLAPYNMTCRKTRKGHCKNKRHARRCSPDAPYDGSRRKLLCHLPLHLGLANLPLATETCLFLARLTRGIALRCFVGMLMLGLTTIAFYLVFMVVFLHHLTLKLA